MALFRKDLKVGFAIGAVALVGGVAYLLFGGGGGDKTADADPFANADPLAVNPAPPTGPNASSAGGLAEPTLSPADGLLARSGDVPTQSWGDALTGRTPTYTQTPGGASPGNAIGLSPPQNASDLRGAFADLAAEVAAGSGASSKPPQTPATPSPSPTADASVHTVEQGDNFSTLAKKFLGDGNLYLLVQQANPGVDSSRLKIGQKVNIPGRAAVEAAQAKIAPSKTAATPTAAAASTVADSGYTHIVAAGETLHSIAERRLGRAALWKDIYALNKAAIGDDPEQLPVGLTLRLPK